MLFLLMLCRVGSIFTVAGSGGLVVLILVIDVIVLKLLILLIVLTGGNFTAVAYFSEGVVEVTTV